MRIKELTEKDVEFTVECLAEHDRPEGHFDSGDPDADRETCAWIRKELDRGNDWAWCTVRVTALYRGFRGVDYLGACSYASEREFMEPGGYFDDMRRSALEALNGEVREAHNRLAPLYESDASGQ